jgi:hypothetical protein
MSKWLVTDTHIQTRTNYEMPAILVQLYSLVLEFWMCLVQMPADILATLTVSVVFLGPYKQMPQQ